MKKLYIVRHAQKAEEVVGQEDYDRSLSQKGINDAKSLASKLTSKLEDTQLILSSPAKRTRDTAEIFAQAINYNKAINYNELLYMPFANELLETITYTFDTIDNLMLIGHNPSLTALAVNLVGFKEKFQMGAVMSIEFECDSWMEISKENAKLRFYEV